MVRGARLVPDAGLAAEGFATEAGFAAEVGFATEVDLDRLLRDANPSARNRAVASALAGVASTRIPAAKVSVKTQASRTTGSWCGSIGLGQLLSQFVHQ